MRREDTAVAVSATQIAGIAGRPAAEVEVDLTTGDRAQPYRIDARGRRWFDPECAGYSLGFTPGQWAGRQADAAIRAAQRGALC
jgi:hypothetical protein